MLNGHFENCYGIKELDLPNIDFSKCNKAIIYAPNGSMKSSLAKVFEDISKGEMTKDRIFQSAISNYSVTYDTNQYSFSSAEGGKTLSAVEQIYVINTFEESFAFTKETVSTMLADEATKADYDALMEQVIGDIRQIEEQLRILTGLTKPQIKDKIINDLGLDETSEWTDIFEKVNGLIANRRICGYLDDCKYSELFNSKTLTVYGKKEFVDSVETYIDNLNSLLENNPVLNEKFTDRNAETLGKELAKHNLFQAQHTIRLKDGVTEIHTLEEWNALVNSELEKLYSAPKLSVVFNKLKKMLTSNAEVTRLRDIIAAHKDILPDLKDIDDLKVQTWLDCFSKLDVSFSEYYSRMTQYTTQMRTLYAQAATQSERWEEVVKEFNRRFRVPFEVQIENKANFLLKDEVPHVSFKYSRGVMTQQTTTLEKEDLMKSLSTGEKRALYLMYILFNLERIRQKASAGSGKFLIVADDIADSFDYKNKYAILEYLNDLGNTLGIDLLVLTHNFDFYRTVKMRLDVKRPNCYIAQRDQEGIVSVTQFRYQRDFFKNVVIQNIKDGKIIDDKKKKLLISSIPFYRNLCEYSGNDKDYSVLTCLLHLKNSPIDTQDVMIADLWDIIKPYLANQSFDGSDEKYFSAVLRIADSCAANTTNEVLLENKLVMAIAIRLCAEKFLQRTITSNGETCVDANSNQTREWFKQAERFLTHEQKSIIEEVNLITPESIHLNSFMFEPLIDISDWVLKELYDKVKKL